MKSDKPRKPPVRRVFGRVKNVETQAGVYTFEMEKPKWDFKEGKLLDAGGVKVRKRGSQTVETLGFDKLVAGNSREVEGGWPEVAALLRRSRA